MRFLDLLHICSDTDFKVQLIFCQKSTINLTKSTIFSLSIFGHYYHLSTDFIFASFLGVQVFDMHLLLIFATFQQISFASLISWCPSVQHALASCLGVQVFNMHLYLILRVNCFYLKSQIIFKWNKLIRVNSYK